MQLNDLPLPPESRISISELEARAAKMQAAMEPSQPKSIFPTSEEIEQVDSASGTTQEVEPEVQLSSSDSTPEPEHVPEKPQAKNFKELKQQMMQMARERDAMARQLEEEKRFRDTPATFIATSTTEPDLHFKEDEYIEAKHANQLAKEIKDLKNQLKSFQEHSTTSIAESRLRAEFPDYDRVFTPENCSALAMLDPDLAATINNDPDTYRKVKLAIKSIKAMGIDTEDTFVAEKSHIQKNAIKPKSSVSISAQASASPLSRANAFENGLTKDLQKQLYQEMMQARKGY